MIPHSEFIQRVFELSRKGVAAEGADVSNQASVSHSIEQQLKPVVTTDSGFVFSKASESELKGVHPSLVEVTRLALKFSTQDFRVYDGLRTPEEQKKLVAQGASKTLNSKHLKQSDGYSHAVDLVPVIGGILKWDWEGCYKIAAAVDAAATQLGVANKIVWGGAWDRTLADFGGAPAAYKREVELYAARHPGPDFLDGPHYEWRG